METVYIETSVISYLVARPPEGTLARQWHLWTKDWWTLRRPFFECVISGEVLREAADGDSRASAARLDALRTCTVLRRTPAVDQVAEVFLDAGRLPPKAKADAAHLAVAAVYGVDYLLTWNLRHLANAIILSRLRPVAEEHGCHLPVVCTPLQLMGNIEYEG
jgi:predicted nucleic acid-binding protein